MSYTTWGSLFHQWSGPGMKTKKTCLIRTRTTKEDRAQNKDGSRTKSSAWVIWRHLKDEQRFIEEVDGEHVYVTTVQQNLFQQKIKPFMLSTKPMLKHLLLQQTTGRHGFSNTKYDNISTATAGIFWSGVYHFFFWRWGTRAGSRTPSMLATTSTLPSVMFGSRGITTA